MNNAITEVVFPFLIELSKNNDRDWFAANKAQFEVAKKEAQHFFEQIGNELIPFDHLEKCKMYRIYRDTRFSQDKTPYKNHFGAIYKRVQPHNRGSFYVHLEPGDTFIGAGFWGPDKDDLFRIRKAIEVEDDLLGILENEDFKNSFGELYGEKLKTAPKGFDKAHPRVDLLQFKQFLLIKHFTDQEVKSPEFVHEITKNYQLLAPFFEYMTSVLTTDENGESII